MSRDLNRSQHSARGTLRLPAAAATTAVAIALSACGGESGQAVQDQAEKQTQKGIDRAARSAKKSGREAALREVDRLEKSAKAELKKNGARRIEAAGDRARSEIERRSR